MTPITLPRAVVQQVPRPHPDAACYLVPALFWLDHEDRCPCDRPEQMAFLLSVQGRQAHIAATPEQLENLRSDAEFYAQGNVDGCAALVRSAKATLAAIAKATVQEGGDL